MFMNVNYLDAREEAEPLLLLPGLICDQRIFAAQFTAFPQARAAADYGDASTLEEMARRVLADAPPRFALLGHSMGARVAVEVLRRSPERVTRLALVSTGMHLPREGEAAGRYRLRDLGRANGHEALVDAWLPPMIGPASAFDHALHARLRAMCVEAGLARFEAQIAALLARPATEDVLTAVHVPTLIAVGSDDRWSPPVQHRAIGALIPHARFVEIADAGHMLPAERPAAFNAAIAEWLAIPNDHDLREGEEK